MRIASDIHGTPVALEALAGFARLQAKQGELEHALELLLIVLNHPASFQDTKIRAEQLCNELEAQLTKQQVEAAWARAQAQPFETVVNEVLEQTELT